MTLKIFKKLQVDTMAYANKIHDQILVVVGGNGQMYNDPKVQKMDDEVKRVQEVFSDLDFKVRQTQMHIDWTKGAIINITGVVQNGRIIKPANVDKNGVVSF